MLITSRVGWYTMQSQNFEIWGQFNFNKMIKINLPNPREMSITEFFAQMKIALKSAEKSYEEIIKGLDLTNANADDIPWISFRVENLERMINLPSRVVGFIEKATIDDFFAEDESQEIYLEIDKL